MARQTRGWNHRRYDPDDERRARDEYRIEELQVFLNSSDNLNPNGYSRPETYAWIEETLHQYTSFGADLVFWYQNSRLPISMSRWPSVARREG